MDLAAAASYFDKMLCVDAFVPATEFYGPLDVFDDSRRDGATVLRRLLSVADGTVIPARRVLTIAGEQWIVGTHEVDTFRGAVIRDKHILHRAHGAATIRTLQQVLTTGGVATYGSKLWVKDSKEVENSSSLTGFFNIYLPSTETAGLGYVIELLGRQHVVRNTFISAAGFLVAESNELEATALQNATFTPRAFSPATDTLTSGTPVALKALRLRFHDDYEYASASAPKMAPGDIRAFIGKALTAAPPKSNDLLALTDGTWLIISVTDEGTAWGLHLRKSV